MDQHSIVDRSPASIEAGREVPGSVNLSTPASVSAGIAAANAHLPQLSEPGARFPGEDGGRSLAEMARRDLDSTLQLLAERAQYITAASGAAIALRRGEHNDMLCRASAGSNAPELGALLSMEYGLSGESVRTRQTLRCDDAENDPRVNREGCRQLGIASVVVMPVVSEQQVLGVFELFSKQPRAFETRDISALQRLSQMVETAVRHAAAAQAVPAFEEQAAVQPELPPEESKPGTIPVEIAVESAVEAPAETSAQAAPDSETELPVAGSISDEPAVKDSLLSKAEEPAANEVELEKVQLETSDLSKVEPPTPKKPLYWSIATQAQANAQANVAEDSIAVPAVLKGLQKCQACGFPVSQGRTFCVECEEKQWRGQRMPASGGAPEKVEPASAGATVTSPAVTSVPDPSVPAKAAALEAASVLAVANPIQGGETKLPSTAPVETLGSDNSTLFLNSSVNSESWFASNKYVLGTLLVVAIVIAAIVWLR